MTEAVITFIVLAVILFGVIWLAESQDKRDDVDRPEIAILQARQGIRLACYLLMYIGIVLALTLGLLVYKLR